MSRFVLQSACRGRRPAKVAPQRMVSRPELVSRLLSDRKAPRFLVAPAGFGKAALACEYAEVVFGFQHVFWINGRSPCFLRDLDAGDIAPSLRADDEGSVLVVFADVPLLDEERSAAFAQIIDGVTAAGDEVIVTTTPACDCPGALRGRRVLIDGRALLVSDGEAARDKLMPAANRRAPLGLAERIACMRWGEEGARELVEGCASEQLPADFRLAMWMMLAMGNGTHHDLVALLGSARAREAWDFLAVRYPLLGIEGDEGVFDAVEVDERVLQEGFGPYLDELAASVGEVGKDGVVVPLVDRMIARGQVRRAARILGCCASKSAVAAWLHRGGEALLWAGAAVEFRELVDQVTRQKLKERSLVNALAAWACAQMDDVRGTLDFARKAVFGVADDTPAVALAALCVCRVGGRSARMGAQERLERWLAARNSSPDGAALPGEDALRLLASVALAEVRREDTLALLAGELRKPALAGRVGAAVPQHVLLAAAWVIDALSATGALEPRREDRALLAREDFSLLIDTCQSALGELARERGTLGFGGLRAADALERIGHALLRGGFDTLPEAVSGLATMCLGEQQRLAEAYRARRGRQLACTLAPDEVRRLAEAASSARTTAPQTPATLVPPLLHVRLFGAMVVKIGDAEVSSALLKRKKARLLLALLVLHRGRELTRESLVSMLWPQTSPRTGAKSFYRLWNELSAMLSVDGQCPYLLRDHHRCHVNASLCTSDIMEFEELIRALLFGLPASAGGWEDVLRQVQESFDGELLPAENHCEAIETARRRFAAELVDGLVAASCRLRAAGELQGALWFAREALRRDATREDAYATLMEAQMAVGQRSGALDTFFACQGYFSRELGLDPSPHITHLYRALIDGVPRGLEKELG